MTMSTMSWGVKSPASQALVHPPFALPWHPAAPGTLKGTNPRAWTLGSWPLALPSLSSHQLGDAELWPERSGEASALLPELCLGPALRLCESQSLPGQRP